MLVAAAIGVAAVLVVLAAAALVRRHRSGRAAGLSLGSPRGPAGVSHLAARVSELSDLGLHLRASATPRRRLGALLGLR